MNDVIKFDNKAHYYGTMIENNHNDVSAICKGSIYYVKDIGCTSNKEVTYHPCVVIQTSYLDKLAEIDTFSITSTPIHINMIPIMMDGTITYINPHRIVRRRIDDFQAKSYMGTIINKDLIDVIDAFILHRFGISCSMDCYINYVNDFNLRNKDRQTYQHKNGDKSVFANSLELKVSFSNEYLGNVTDDYVADEYDETESIDDTTTEETSNEAVDSICEEVPVVSEKEIITIDLNDHALLSIIDEIEKIPANEFTLPRFEKMSKDEIKVMMAYSKLYGIKQTSILYNCCVQTIRNRSASISERYTINFVS